MPPQRQIEALCHDVNEHVRHVLHDAHFGITIQESRQDVSQCKLRDINGLDRDLHLQGYVPSAFLLRREDSMRRQLNVRSRIHNALAYIVPLNAIERGFGFSL